MYLLHITYRDDSERWLVFTASELRNWQGHHDHINIKNIVVRYFYSHEWRHAILSSDRETEQLHRTEHRDSDDLGGGFA